MAWLTVWRQTIKITQSNLELLITFFVGLEMVPFRLDYRFERCDVADNRNDELTKVKEGVEGQSQRKHLASVRQMNCHYRLTGDRFRQ